MSVYLTKTTETALTLASTWEGGTGERESHHVEENCTRDQKEQLYSAEHQTPSYSLTEILTFLNVELFHYFLK